MQKAIACLLAAVSLGSLIAAPHTGQASETYHTCTGFIDSLPATISTQGTWCLRNDLATAISNGAAIEIKANNVTIECNNFKIGGLAAGNNSIASGVYTWDRQNVTIRNCHIRGFAYGVDLYGGTGHLVQDNLLSNSIAVGIAVYGGNSIVRRNRIFDTGGNGNATGIYGPADIIDNTISGLFTSSWGGNLAGVSSNGSGNVIHGNKVSGFDTTGLADGVSAFAQGFHLWGSNQRVSDNQIIAENIASGTGISAGLYSGNFCLNNTVSGFTTSIDGDCIGSRNLSGP